MNFSADYRYLTTSNGSQGSQTQLKQQVKRPRTDEEIEIAILIVGISADRERDSDSSESVYPSPMILDGQPSQREFTCLSDDEDIFSAEEDSSGEVTDPAHCAQQKKVKKSFTATPADPFFHGRIKFFDESIQILFLTIIAEANQRQWHEAKQIGDLLKAYSVFVKSQAKSKADREYNASDEKVFFERIASILLKKDHSFATNFEFTKTKLERSPGSYNITASKIITLATSIEGKLIDPILQRGFDQETFSTLITAGYDNLFE